MSNFEENFLPIWVFLVVDEEETKILTLEPLAEDTQSHDTVFINELKLFEFKQVLAKSNIPSEFSGGVLWCCNGTLAIRRVCGFIYVRILYLIKIILLTGGEW